MGRKRTFRWAVFLGGMLLAATGCSTRQAVQLALADDPEAALRSLAQSREASYRQNPLALVQDLRTARARFQHFVDVLRGEAAPLWGRDDTLLPGKRRYVKYTQNYKSRAVIDFDRGEVVVETVDTEAPHRSLRSAVVTTLLTPEDPRAVDLYSAREVRLSGEPYLYGLVRDHRGRIIASPTAAEAYADYLVERQRHSRRADGEPVQYVRFALISDYTDRQAHRYAPLVRRYASRYGVSESLVLAVMKTESAFNPYAVSSAPAYGLMQLVPETGGRDAFRRVEGYDHTPSREYLFDPVNNVELGTAYLSILSRDYLAGIHDPVKLEYCTIAAYNGGAGNVLRLFSPDRGEAVHVINRLSTAEVYARLRHDHPREETRRYLTKVLDARREFVSI